MKSVFYVLTTLCIIGFSISLHAQENNGGGRLSGNFQANANFFQRDSSIQTPTTPQYDRQLYGSEAWLNLNYTNWGFDFGVRFDFFQNSNLLNPNDSYTDQGIGRWFVRKKINKLDIFVGYLYDQIGSGIIFRAYEERPLLIDNALFGARLTYEIAPDWELKAFSGRQKQQFDEYGSVIKGGSLEGFLIVGEEKPLTLAPGIGIVNRTLDDQSMDNLLSEISTYPDSAVFVPTYNTYAFSIYNTLTAGPISWYAEAAYKTDDNISNLDPVDDRVILESGTVFYTSLSYAKKGLGISLEGKRTENFSFRTRPQEKLNQGLVNFLPPLTRLNTYRLTARYNAATQELGEMGFQADVRYSPNRKLSFNVNYSNIQTLEDLQLFEEIYTEISYKFKRKWSILGGVQRQRYNQEVYEIKPDVPIVETIVPYFDFLYKFSRKQSIRFEAQYMVTGEDEQGVKHDFGDWLFGMVEISIAPHWIFAISDMYNIDPGKNSPVNEEGVKDRIHYPRFDIYYTNKSNRFSLSYIKQVEGVVCAGGICRLEPAFSGFRMSVQSSF